MKKMTKIIHLLGAVALVATLSACTATQKDTVLSGTNNKTIEESVTDTTSDTAPTEEYIVDKSDFVAGNTLIGDMEKEAISEEEKAGLILMREEEKLARDVYRTLGDKWDMRIFDNIAGSEQTHTNAVKVLLDRYDIGDPVRDDTVGTFTSPTMQKLYDDLVAQGQNSLLDAVTVGAIVEDLDINDLRGLLEQTDNADITTVYENLLRGSRNHLRAYIRQVDRNGGDYTPQYISQETFDAIIASEQERGDGQHQGQGDGNGGQKGQGGGNGNGNGSGQGGNWR